MVENPSWCVESARSGEPTVLLNGKALHSRFDPVREAERVAASVPMDASIVVLGGLGLGYVAEALIRRAPGRRLIIAEADETMPARAAAVRDIGPIFKNVSTTIFSGGKPGDIRNLLTGGPAGSRIHLLIWRPSEESDPDWYNELKSAVEETARRRQVNARTLERFGRLWIRNLSANTVILPGALSLAQWSDYFRDIPALILAGGPSLEGIIDTLPALAERYLIIAVDTAVPAVLRTGISPDIIAAVDPQYWNTRHLDRCGSGAGNALILAESATHPAVFRSLGGTPWLMRTKFPLGTILEDAAGIDGELKAGGSVATAAWDLGRHLGCSTLTIAGLDLGFPGGRTHYAGSLSRERPHFYSCRTATAQTAFFHALRDASPRYTESNAGGRVLTDMRMDIYAAWFTESVKTLGHMKPAVVGGQGRKIPGMAVTDIDEMMKLPEKRTEIDILLGTLRNTSERTTAKENIQQVLIRTLSILDRLETDARYGEKLSLSAITALKHGENIAGMMESLEKIDERILSGDGRDVISFLIQPIILELSSDTAESSADPLSDSQRLYSEIAGSAAYHRHYLSRALDQSKTTEN